MEIPNHILPGLAEYTGPVLVYLVRGVVARGFQLSKDEFVTSLNALTEARIKAGLEPVD